MNLIVLSVKRYGKICSNDGEERMYGISSNAMNEHYISVLINFIIICISIPFVYLMYRIYCHFKLGD